MRIHSLPLVLLIVCVFIQLPKSVQAQHSDKQEHSKQTDLRAFKRLVPYNKPATSVTNKGCIAIHQYNNGPLWAVKITNICSQKVQARLCAIVETFQGSYDSCRRQPGFLSTTDRIGYVYEGIPVERVLRGESYLIPGQSLNLTTAPKSLCAEELRFLNTVDKSQSRKHFLVADSGIRFCLDADGPLVYADPIRSLRLFVDYCRPQTILNKFCVLDILTVIGARWAIASGLLRNGLFLKSALCDTDYQARQGVVHKNPSMTLNRRDPFQSR